MSEQQPTDPAQPPDWETVQRHCLAVLAVLSGAGDSNHGPSPEQLLPAQGADLLRFAAEAARLLHGLDQTRRPGGDFETPPLSKTLPGSQTTDGPSEQEVAALWGSLLVAWRRVLTVVPVVPEQAASEADPAWSEYAKASLAYTRLLQDSSRRALVLLEADLNRRLEAGTTLGSLRELYNLWVDCSEQAHAEMLRQSRYSHAYGQLINALLRCQRADPGSGP